MSGGQAEVILNDYVDAFNAHDAKRVSECYSADGQYEDMALGHKRTGHAQHEPFMKTFFEAFPDITLTVSNVIVQKDNVAWEWMMEGNHVKEVVGGIKVAEGRNSFRGAAIGKFQEGKILLCRDYWNAPK